MSPPRAVACLLDAKAELGECPRWHAGEERLYFVDIARAELHRYHPQSGAHEVRGFEEPVGCFAFRRGGGFVLAMRDGFWALADFAGTPQPIGPMVDAARPDNRFNDGRCDARGRFFAGTMTTTKRVADGALFRLDPDGRAVQLEAGVLTSNGIAFSPDARTFYYADTPNHVIYAYDFDAERGAIANRRVFREFPYGQGRPDGAAVDSDGDYWSALYAGGRVVRLSPQGAAQEEVAIPALHVTCISFGGPDLCTAFVTTARANTDAAALARYPLAGGIFTFRVERPGLAEPMYAG